MGGTNITTSGSGKTVTISVVQGTAFEKIQVDAVTPPGVNPILPDVNGLLTMTGGQVSSGTTGANVIRTNTVAQNSLRVEIQRSASSLVSDVAKNGVAHFNSAQYTVDADGFVTSATGSAITRFHPDSGTDPVTPDSTGAITTTGSGSTTVVGGVASLSFQLTGLTNHAVLVGAGTTTITKVGPTATAGQVLQSAGAAADPAFSTATYPLTTTINQILYSSAANTVTGLATANQAVLTTGATGIPVLTALATNGQLIIGSTAGVPAAATLTAGAGISITNGANSITIATSGGGFTWTDVTGATQAMAIENGYATDRGGGVTYTLPATATFGDEMKIVGKLGLTTIAQNANQQIVVGSSSSTVGAGGSIAGTNVGDCITLRCTTGGASTIWIAEAFTGNWTVT